jgi:hypothetical protein
MQRTEVLGDMKVKWRSGFRKQQQYRYTGENTKQNKLTDTVVIG